MKKICLTIIGLTLNTESKISIKTLFEAPEKGAPADDFGRPTQAPMNNPGDVKSDRIGNAPDAVNNAILTKGWLRISDSNIDLKVPALEGETPSFPKDTLKLNGTNVSQEPLDMNDKFSEAKDKQDGFLVNPLWKAGSKEVPCPTCFYFRVSGLSIYFTQLKEDMTVIGQVAIKNIKELVPFNGPSPCFTVTNMHTSWKLCAASKAEEQEWQCSVKQAMRDPCGGAKKEESKEGALKEIEGNFNIVQPEWILPMPSPWCNQDWNYASLGTNWECRCHDGENQSPIDLPSTDILEVINLGADIMFNKVDTEMIVEKNGVALQPRNKEESFGTMTSQVGDQQTAQKVIFHNESDHTVNGQRQPLEAQILYKSSDPFKAGKNAIVSILFKDDVGAKNPVLEQFAFDMLSGHGVYKGDAGLDITKLFHDKDWKPDPMAIGKAVKFNYQLQGGSLPFPPCTENTWMIVKSDAVGIAAYYAEYFAKTRDFQWAAGKQQRSSVNFRGTQRAFRPEHMMKKERKVQQVKNLGCDAEDEEPEEEKEGHWEAIKHVGQQYIYVDDTKPSGLPGSFVIPSKDVGK